MKYSIAIAAIAAASASAQLNVITGVMSNVGNAIDALDSAVKSFSSDFSPIQEKATDLISSLKQGLANVTSASDLALNDAISLTAPTQSLITKSQTLETDFKAKVNSIEKANACDSVRTSLGAITNASTALTQAINAKLPEQVKDLAAKLSAQDTAILVQAQKDFSEANCKSSGGGGNKTMATPASTTAASANTASAAAGAALFAPPCGLALVFAAALL